MPITEKQTVCVNSGFAHPADTTKQVQFDMSGIAANTPAVVTVPNASGTMALVSTGSWTPVATFSSSNGDRSHAIQVGSYTRVGNLVTLTGFITFTETTASGSLRITGLPFAAKTLTDYWSAGSCRVNGMSGLSGGVQMIIQSSESILYLSYSGVGSATNIDNTNTGASSSVMFSITYEAAP